MGAPYGHAFGQIQLCFRYVSSCLYTFAYSVGDKQYYLSLGGWVSGSSLVISCVMWSKDRNIGSKNTSENLSNKAKIYGSLSPRARGVWGPSYSLSSTSLSPIAKRLPDSHNSVNQAALCDLQMVFIKECKEHSSTQVSHNNKVPSTT